MRGLNALRTRRCCHVPSALHRSAAYALIRRNATATTAATVPLADNIQQGHISVAPDEAVLFINNILPLRLQWLYRLLLPGETFSVEGLLKHVDKPSYAAADHWAIVQRALPPDLKVQVKQVIPRLSEGGLFIKYSIPPPSLPTADGKQQHQTKRKDEIAAAVDAYLEKNPIRPWFNPFDRVGVGRVLGKPWIEDMYHLPSPKIKVEFLPSSASGSPEDLTPEALYSIFRRYGKIKIIERQPADSKILPKYAIIEFNRAKYAILARSCIHGITIPDDMSGIGSKDRETVLKVSYEPKIRAHWIRDWIFNHPRIVIPAIAAVIAGITVIIFDPIRTFFIKIKVKYLLNADDNQALWSWIRKEVRKANFLSFRKRSEKNVLRAIWDDRKAEIALLQSWLIENANTFIVVQGPHGSGKREIVVDQALRDRKHKLIIDCKQIQEARGDAQTISVAAQQVGYRPVFSWMNSMSSFIDLASQAVIGTKAGFSETLDSQLSKIWTNTATALRQIALENRRQGDRDIELSDEEYLEAHPEKRPVVVIDNFLYAGTQESIVNSKIAEWAAALVTSNIAHVIFLTPEVSYSKSLSKALPSQVFRAISLGDCSLEVGRDFILRYLQHREAEGEKEEPEPGPNLPPQGLDDLDECIKTVGGRLTDLEFMAHRIKSGETPKSAVKHIIEQAATEILKVYVLEASHSESAWTREQAWYLIKKIGEDANGSVPYGSIVLSDLFAENGEQTLSALEQTDLITVVSVNGRPSAIKCGRPVYHAAFKHLNEDQALRSRLDLGILGQLMSKESSKVSKYESELQLLGSLKKYPYELNARVQYVAHKLQEAQAKLEKYERQSGVLATSLQTAE